MKPAIPFQIEIKRLYWVNDDGNDYPHDLCLHGEVAATIGAERFEESCTVSATGLYLLKTLTENHVIGKDNQMLPCCGHFLIPSDDGGSVTICGCPNGVDWAVEHKAGGVAIRTESGNETFVGMGEYRNSVFAFADTVKACYDKCTGKIPSDTLDECGYSAFWNEWARRRGSTIG